LNISQSEQTRVTSVVTVNSHHFHHIYAWTTLALAICTLGLLTTSIRKMHRCLQANSRSGNSNKSWRWQEVLPEQFIICWMLISLFLWQNPLGAILSLIFDSVSTISEGLLLASGLLQSTGALGKLFWPFLYLSSFIFFIFHPCQALCAVFLRMPLD
jgi:hypothetical protein